MQSCDLLNFITMYISFYVFTRLSHNVNVVGSSFEMLGASTEKACLPLVG